APNRVFDRDDRPSLEFKGWQHRGELVYFNRVIAIGEHVAAPISNPNYEHLDVEGGWFFPFAKHIENSLLRPLILHCRTLRAFVPGDHVFHAYPQEAPLGFAEGRSLASATALIGLGPQWPGVKPKPPMSAMGRKAAFQIPR